MLIKLSVFYLLVTSNNLIKAVSDLEVIRSLLAFDYKSGLPWKVNPNASKINLQDTEYDCSQFSSPDATFIRAKPCVYYEPYSQISGVFWYWDNSVKSRDWSAFFNVTFDDETFFKEKWYKSAMNLDKWPFENFNV